MDVSSVGDRQVDGSTCTAVVSCLQQARDRQKKKNLNNSNSRANDRSIIAERENHHLGQIISTGLAGTPRNKIDPYQELELYLARVIEEIDEIIVTSLPSQSIQASIPAKKLEASTIINTTNNNNLDNDDNSSDEIIIRDNLNSESLGINKAKQSPALVASRVSNKLNLPSSKTSSVDVPPLIGNTRPSNDINTDKIAAAAAPVIEYRDLLSEFGLLDSDGTESCPDSNNSSEYYDKQLLSISEDSISDSNVKQSSHIISINNNQSKDYLARSKEVEAKKISGSWPGIDYSNKIIISNTDSHKIDNKLLLSSLGNSSSLPASLDSKKDTRSKEIQPNTLSNSIFDNPNNNKCTAKDVKCCCKPPRQVNDTNCNKNSNKNSWSPMSRRCRSSSNSFIKSKLSPSRTEEETTDADYDDVFIDDKANLRLQLIDTTPRSAPVTPTDEKTLAFTKLFRKKYPLSISCSEGNCNGRMSDAILVRVSSLPDQDLLDITSDKNNHLHHHHHHHQEFNRHPMKKKRRAISPLTLRSDISAKRLSESDKDVSQISPVQLKTFFPLNNNGQNDVAVGCDLPRGGKNSSDTSIESGKSDKFSKNEYRKVPTDDSSRSVSLPISLTALFSRLRNGGSCCPNSQPMETFNCSNMATQTSPAISRSSSFTWVSDCDSPRAESHVDEHSLQDESALDLAASPQDTVDDDNRSSSSSQDLVQSLDEISSGSTSPDTTDRASPLESGIGTASPPRSTDRRSIKPLINNKCCRKETWERIRRRPSKLNSRSEKGSTDVWVRRESVYTQTRRNQDKGSQEAVDSSSGVDDTLPRSKLSRPTNLIIDTSSSLSSGEMLETLPLSSPNSQSQPTEVPAENIDNQETQNHPLHFQPDHQLSEIEAQEACKWLRAAGFPQYAQMYEDYQFPIDVSGVAKDHPFLEADSLQSLYRRLDALNRCANMKLDTHHTHHHHHSNHHHNTGHSKTSGGGGGGRDGGGDDSDEDTQCALSENWTFEKKTRRWSRICDISQANVERLQAIAAGQLACPDDSLEDRLETEEPEETMIVHGSVRFENLTSNPNSDDMSPKFRRTGSERLRDGAKAFLRRVESLKSRRRKRQNREGVVISGPQVLDVISMQQKMKDLNCVDVSPTGLAPVSFGDTFLLPSPNPPSSPVTLPNSPYHMPSSNLMTTTSSPFGDDSSSYCSDGSQSGGPTNTHTITSSSTTGSTRTKLNKAKRFLYRGGGMKEDQGALSDSECQPSNWRHKYLKDANSNHTKVLEYLTSQSAAPAGGATHPMTITTRGGSLNLGKDSQRYRDKLTGQSKLHDKELKVAAMKREDKLHRSFRHAHDDLVIDRKQQQLLIKHHQQHQQQQVTVYREKSRSRSSELAASQESSSTMASRDSDPEDESPRHKGTVVRWHSFQRGSLYPEPLDPLCPRAMASMSCGQLLVLRKLALLKLTACMERYCPTHRTGWNWELPKFIRKIKTPDYKDKTVFGVPLLLSLQRTGQALPKCIQIALRWLRANALDQVGIFRKSGVRSRIQKLKAMTEIQGDNINFDGQQAFDVADLVKQYFRELPEALLTNKLSETFIAIFQHVPVELRPDAVQSVLLLLPDEHREALETLLDFLNHVASNSPYNQMTASNLAVCLAPSLFHLNHNNSNTNNRSSSVSPRRRKTVGIPDQRELSENKAAHDCLLYLVKMHRELFMVSSDMLTQCHFNYMEESVPVGLEELGSEMKQDWRGYMYACTTALLKEAREKSRGWVTVSNPADTSVEMAYKKVGDGHPLRLWRVSTEVEAPPHELLHRVLRERHIWDPQLLKYRMVKKLDANAEIFQYAAGNMSPLPARDYCVLRTWRTDLPKDACVIVETSVQHPDAPVMLGGTRGIVLASRYLIEKSGSGKSRIMHLSRVDTKGRTPEWYNKSYGHIAALYLSKIRNSFKHSSDGPESKV